MAVNDSELSARLSQEVAASATHDPSNDDSVLTEQAFTHWCTELMEERDFIEDFSAASWMYQPPGQANPLMKINGFSADFDDGSAVVFVTHWNTITDKRLTAGVVQRIAGSAVEFVKQSVSAAAPLSARLEPANSHTDFSRSLLENRDDLRRLTVVILTNAVTSIAELPAVMLGDLPVLFDIWDARRLVRLLEAGEAPEPIIIDMVKELGSALPCLKAPAVDPRYEAYLAVMPAEALARIYDRFGSRILEQNVRVYLQLSGKVNKGIRKTLLNEPGLFFAYNNGISATVHAASFSGGERGEITHLTGLQIVNGAQTTGSIHRTWRENSSALKKVFVQVKLTAIGPDARQEIGDNISSFANSQNAVKAADFSARNPFHVRVEELARRVATPKGESHWYYERMRGQYHDELERLTPAKQKLFRASNPPRQRIVKTDIATLIHIWEKHPELVCLGAQKNFVRFCAGWLTETEKDWKPDEIWFREIVARAILWGEIYAAVRRSEVVGYQSQVAVYLATILVEKMAGRLKLATIWDNQAISTALLAMIESWCKRVHDLLVATANGQAVDMWCRKPACWIAIRESLDDFSIPSGLAEAGAVVPLRGAEPMDLSADREARLRVAREVTTGRVIKREDAVKELQRRFGIARLTEEKRSEIESLLADITRLAFLDTDETAQRDKGLAILRSALRSGVRTEQELVKRMATEWLEVQRVGARVRASIEDLFAHAVRRQVLAIADGKASCPTPSFDDYTEDALKSVILEVLVRKNRLYSRRSVVEAVIAGIGLAQQRETTQSRIDACIAALVRVGSLEVPSEGVLRLSARA